MTGDDERTRRSAGIAAGACVLSLAVLVLVFFAITGLRDSNAMLAGRVEALLEDAVDQQVLVTVWKYKAANGVCVSTSLSTPKDGMTDSLWVRTHNASVEAAQDPANGGHPPDPECNR